jgi:hypothetical protein
MSPRRFASLALAWTDPVTLATSFPSAAVVGQPSTVTFWFLLRRLTLAFPIGRADDGFHPPISREYS